VYYYSAVYASFDFEVTTCDFKNRDLFFY